MYMVKTTYPQTIVAFPNFQAIQSRHEGAQFELEIVPEGYQGPQSSRHKKGGGPTHLLTSTPVTINSPQAPEQPHRLALVRRCTSNLESVHLALVSVYPAIR
jgi:hypothetical protein